MDLQEAGTQVMDDFAWLLVGGGRSRSSRSCLPMKQRHQARLPFGSAHGSLSGVCNNAGRRDQGAREG